MGVAVSLEWIAVSTHPHLTQEGFLDVIYVGIVHPSGGNQRNRMWVQNSGADDYIRKVDRLSRQLGPPPSLSTGLSSLSFIPSFMHTTLTTLSPDPFYSSLSFTT